MQPRFTIVPLTDGRAGFRNEPRACVPHCAFVDFVNASASILLVAIIFLFLWRFLKL